MACNCKTNEEIDKLYRAYGEKIQERGKTFKDEVKRVFLFLSSILMWIICIPMMLIYVLFLLFWQDDKKINVQSVNIMRIKKFFENV